MAIEHFQTQEANLIEILPSNLPSMFNFVTAPKGVTALFTQVKIPSRTIPL
jgi:hypothetical protein